MTLRTSSASIVTPRVAAAFGLCLALLAACSTKVVGDSTSNPPTRAELSDGSIGSSCGTCDTGLTCESTAPGGYCTKSCSAEGACGARAHCYSRTTGGGFCIRACRTNTDCRMNYECKGDADSAVCLPVETSTPGGAPDGGRGTGTGTGSGSGTSAGTGTPGGDCTPAAVVGWWGTDCAVGTCEQIQLTPDGRATYELFDGVNTTRGTGTYQLRCPSVAVTLTEGDWADKTLSFFAYGSELLEDGTKSYKKCGATRCF